MSAPQERILIVENDPEISDLIARQALRPLGYKVKVVHEAPMAIQEAIRFSPDVLIANLNQTGLSGKDLLVALSAQGLDMPVIVLAEQGMEGDVIQAFRLGASDYVGWPIREAEVVAAVERGLTQVRSAREREQLARKVKETNQKLQSRVRELTTILGIGKAVTSITDRRALFKKIIEGAVFVSEADKGWLLLREGDSKTFKLSAQRNLPKTIAGKIDQPWDDGISSLVSLSGESLSIHGVPLRRFRISRLGKSALVVPVKIQKEVVGLMVVVRDDPKPFTSSNKTLLEALADYASISLVNVKLFQAVEERARSLMEVAEADRESERVKAEILQKMNEELKSPLAVLAHEVERLAGDPKQLLSKEQMRSIRLIREQLHRTQIVVGGLATLQRFHSSKNLMTINLVDLAKKALERFQNTAKEESVLLTYEFSSRPATALVDLDQINQVFDALLSNAIRVSPKGKVILRVETDKTGSPHVLVKDSGPGISKVTQAKIFQPFIHRESSKPEDLDHLGISLAIAKEVIKAHGGQMWVESQLGQGSTFHFTLKRVN